MPCSLTLAGEFLEGFGVEVLAGLERVASDLGDRHVPQFRSRPGRSFLNERGRSPGERTDRVPRARRGFSRVS